ncbi:MAG: ATP-dependent DNA helicase [Gomphosphaeria aponina SAG 52.96 = DSM 107014]|uniref:ATP-dependent DNA helicase n=1 Tax=Gomphosphaeria aponina SAG 52.96 = DSM 107014 TaxID=1521640 RepID=A0A941GWX7_9CHRO|nr:ATP-dependent DNA helicase [Gomphosphaeria aponina SAG 52.96 = DSM 107014]
MLEAKVHSYLRGFLREQDNFTWPHHLTMARLVARALRLGRSALIQTGTRGLRYPLSYLTPALLEPKSVVLVVPPLIQEQLLAAEIPQLQQWLNTNKEIITNLPHAHNFSGLILTSPETWLNNHLAGLGHFAGIPTIIDSADFLEEVAAQQLTEKMGQQDWDKLMAKCPKLRELIRNVRIKLTKTLFAHPPNPYQCYTLDPEERKLLQDLLQTLAAEAYLTPNLIKFWQYLKREHQILWAEIVRDTGQFTLYLTPLEVATTLRKIWQQQPTVLIGAFLDWEKNAPTYGQQLGISDVTCLKFAPNPHNEQIQLYLPERLPMPNTPQFQGAIMEQLELLVGLSSNVNKLVVLIVGDVPLKAQVGAKMAAEFGSRVQVEKTNLTANSILVSGWEFWEQNQHQFPIPQLLVITTLPLPSLENPLVAAKVAYYKSQRLDWFRLYLLPTALREIQRAVVCLRASQGVVALLDSRVNHRSYGTTILTALEPYIRYNYLDPSWFGLDWR